MNIFTYGTLMDTEIMQMVTQGEYVGKPAVLHGFERYGIRGEPYPGVIEKPDGSVEGILYVGVTGESVYRLDVFEGDLYERKEVQVMPMGGSAGISAMVYVVRPECRHLVTAEKWDFETFLEQGKGEFTGGYQGFEDLKSS